MTCTEKWFGKAQEILHWVHRVFSNLKRRAKGVFHGLRQKHIQRCLDEFVFRWNRRRNLRTAFDRLLGICVGLAPDQALTLSTAKAAQPVIDFHRRQKHRTVIPPEFEGKNQKLGLAGVC